nr:translation initiation factor [Tanacetum cinerariifolium]
CERHPDADKLSLTTVAVGDDMPRQIVCGAPNVAAGQRVVVALEGAMLHPSTGEPFKIKKSKIRGAASEGMICAEDEIGLGQSHAGIMVLDTDLPDGTPAAEYFGLGSDTEIEIGLTPNRADAASHYGVARELRALLGQPLHAFDANQIAGGKIRVKRAEAGEKFVTLDGVERSLQAEDLVIADANGAAMALAGVFGGKTSG